MMFLLLLLRLCVAQHYQIYTGETAEKCFGSDPITHPFTLAPAQFQSQMIYSRGLMLYGWYQLRMNFEQVSDCLLVASLYQSSGIVMRYSICGQNQLTLQNPTLQATQVVTYTTSWQWFVVYFDATTSDVQMLLDQAGQITTKAVDGADAVYAFLPERLLVYTQYDPGTPKQNGCILWRDLAVSIAPPGVTDLAGYAPQMQRLGTDALLSYSLTAAADPLPSNPISNELSLKADLYMGQKKDTLTNAPSFVSGFLRFVGNQVMTLVDYGALGLVLQTPTPNLIFAFWCRVSSNMIDFTVLQLAQPLIDPLMPSLAIGFEKGGSGHLLSCFFAQEYKIFSDETVEMLGKWQHWTLVLRTDLKVSYVDGYSNGELIESFSFKRKGQIDGQHQLYLGSLSNNYQGIYANEYFELRGLRMLTGSFLQSNREPASCILEAARCNPPQCLLCRQGYILLQGVCVTDCPTSSITKEQCSQTCPVRQYLEREKSDANTAAYQRSAFKQSTTPIVDGQTTVVETFTTPMNCVPSVFLFVPRVEYVSKPNWLVLEPLTVQSVTNAQFTLAFDSTMAQVKSFSQASYVLTCDPNYLVGYVSKQSFSSKPATFDVKLPSPMDPQLPLSATIVSYSTFITQVSVTQVKFLNADNIQIKIDSTDPVNKQNWVSFKYIIGAPVSEVTGVSQSSSTITYQSTSYNLQYVNGYTAVKVTNADLTQQLDMSYSISPQAPVSEDTALRNNLKYTYKVTDDASDAIASVTLDATKLLFFKAVPVGVAYKCTQAVQSANAPYQRNYAFDPITAPGTVTKTITLPENGTPLVAVSVSKLSLTASASFDLSLDVQSGKFDVKLVIEGTDAKAPAFEIRYCPIYDIPGEQGSKTFTGTIPTSTVIQFQNKYAQPPKVLVSLGGWKFQGSTTNPESVAVQATQIDALKFTLTVQRADTLTYLRVNYVVLESSPNFMLNSEYLTQLRQTAIPNLNQLVTGFSVNVQYGSTPGVFFYYALTKLAFTRNDNLLQVVFADALIMQSMLGVQLKVEQGSLSDAGIQYTDFMFLCNNPRCKVCDKRNPNICDVCLDQGRTTPNCLCPEGFYDEQGSACRRCTNPRCAVCNVNQVCEKCYGGLTAPQCDCAGQNIDPQTQQCIPNQTVPAQNVVIKPITTVPVLGTCNGNTQNSYDVEVTQSEAYTIQAWVKPEAVGTAIKWSMAASEYIVVAVQASKWTVSSGSNNFALCDGIQTRVGKWLWVVAATAQGQLKGYIYNPNVWSDGGQTATTQPQFVQNSITTIQLGLGSFCGQISNVFFWQGFDLTSVSYKNTFSVQAANPPTLLRLYSTSGQYFTQQTIYDQSGQNENTQLGPTLDKDGPQDPQIDMQQGFFFPGQQAFIPVPNAPQQEYMTYSFWLQVPDGYGAPFKLDLYPSQIYLYRTVQLQAMLYETTKSFKTTSFSIHLVLGYYSQNAQETGYRIRVCVSSACMMTDNMIPIALWQFVAVSVLKDVACTTCVVVRVQTATTLTEKPITLNTAQLSSPLTYLGLTENDVTRPQAGADTLTLQFLINQFQITNGGLARNPGSGAYNLAGGSYIFSGFPGGIALLCASNRALNNQNQCVVQTRAACNGPDTNQYYVSQQFRQCMKCINADLTTDCTCLPGYYLDEVDQCSKCGVRCVTCTAGVDDCKECAVGRINPPACTCLDGYYEDSQRTCKACNSTRCVTCVDYNTCSVCAAKRESPPACSCMDGFYESGGNCLQCNLNRCVRCDKTPDNCTRCRPERDSEENQCRCLPGFVEDSVTGQCLKCNQRCTLCERTVDNCTACAMNRIGINKCDCKSGYFDLKGKCEPCSMVCAECAVNSLSCLSCKGANRSVIPMCECNEGYYESEEKVCIKCLATTCQSCIKEASNCTVCAPLRIDPPSCLCQDGYFEDTEGNCVRCDSTYNECQKCTHKGCMVCNIGFVVVNGRCFRYKGQKPIITEPCLEHFRDSNQYCKVCSLGYLLQINECVFVCPSDMEGDIYSNQYCSNSATKKFFNLQQQLYDFGLPTQQPSWDNAYSITLMLTKLFSPLTPALTCLTQQLYLITLPLFMQVKIPPSTWQVMRSLYFISPYPWMFYISFFMFRDYENEYTTDVEYYINDIDSFVVWTMLGQQVTTLMLIVLFKYSVYFYQRIRVCLDKKNIKHDYNRKKRADDAVEDDDDNLSVDSNEENEAEDLLNQEMEQNVAAGELEMQDFSKAYQDVSLNTDSEKLLDSPGLIEQQQPAVSIPAPQKRVSAQINSQTLKVKEKRPFSTLCVNLILQFKLPKIPFELQYTYVFACMMELAIIPLTFGSLSTIILSRDEYFYIVWGAFIYCVPVIYAFLVVYLCGYRHYTKSWQHLRMFYTQLTYVEWYQEINNKVFNYTNFRVRLVLMVPAFFIVRNIIVTTFFVLIRYVPQLALILSFITQAIAVGLVLILRPYYYQWLNFFWVFLESLLATFYLLLFVAHQQMDYYLQQESSSIQSQYLLPFDVLQTTSSGLASIEGLGTFMIVVIFLYIFCNMIMVGLRTLFVFARATYNFDKLRCRRNANLAALEPKKPDLEYSCKSKTMLLRDRLPRGQSCIDIISQIEEPLPAFWKRMSAKVFVQQIHTQNITNYQRVDLRTRTRIRKIPQYDKWVQRHDMEMEEEPDIQQMDMISEINEDPSDFVSQKYSLAQEYQTIKRRLDNEIQAHFLNNLNIIHFQLIIELLDSNMDNPDILIGRRELESFIYNDLLLPREQFDLMEDPDQEMASSREMISETLQHIESARIDDKSWAESVESILNHLRGVIIVANERELDELLLSGLFAIKYFCKRLNNSVENNLRIKQQELIRRLNIISLNLGKKAQKGAS